MEFFELRRDLTQKHKWRLDTPKLASREPLDISAFSAGSALCFNSQLIVPVEHAGDVMELTFSHYFLVYILPRIGNVLEAFSSWDVQRLPALLENGDAIEILNVLTVLDCFDPVHSHATYKREGIPNMVIELRIRPEMVQGHHVFRIKNWLGPLIVSELILEQFDKVGARGFVATKVS